MMVAAKAWVSLLGVIITAVLAGGVVPVHGVVQTWLTIISIICTAVGTWAVPNRPVSPLSVYGRARSPRM